MLKVNTIYQMDCLDGMKQIDTDSIDMILCDIPYGVTNNQLDIVIPLDKLWEQYKRVIKTAGAIVLTSQFPFTIELVLSNKKWFRYDLIWNKLLTSGFLNANRMPLRVHEHILVFYDKLPTYHPQFTKGKPTHSRGALKAKGTVNYSKYEQVETNPDLGNKKHPTSIINIQKVHASKALHPTEKPVELFEWLIKTYSNEEEMILDNCMGSGTTAVACRRTGRNFIGFEINEKYYRIAYERLNQQTLSDIRRARRK